MVFWVIFFQLLDLNIALVSVCLRVDSKQARTQGVTNFLQSVNNR